MIFRNILFRNMNERILKKHFWEYKIFVSFFLELENKKKIAVGKNFILKNTS